MGYRYPDLIEMLQEENSIISKSVMLFNILQKSKRNRINKNHLQTKPLQMNNFNVVILYGFR